MTEALAVINQKGGVGKTTTAVGLGELVARLDGPRRVVVVDLDGSQFARNDDSAIGDASTWAAMAQRAGDPLAVTIVEPPAEVTPVRLPGWIRSTFPDQLVIFDCPPLTGGGPAHEAATEVVAERGGAVVVPATQARADATSTANTLTTIAGDGPSVAIMVVLVMMETNTIRARQIRPELAALISGDPANDIPPLEGVTVLDAEVPKRAEVEREAMAPVESLSLMLNLYEPVLKELRERIR